MEVIIIYDENHDFFGVAENYHSAILCLVEYEWITEDLKVWNEKEYRLASVIELLGEEWFTKTLAMTVDEFNDFYESRFTLVVEDVISYPDA